MDLARVDTIIEAIILLIPAMVANASPVVFKGKTPIDRGATFIDGKRLLGDGKTVEGFLAGLICGSLSSIPLAALVGTEMLATGPAASLGALIGDLLGSFIKRRIGLKRGAPAPLLDQLDFYVGAVVATTLLGYSWSLTILIVSGVIVALLHMGSNYLAYRMGLKSVPW